MPRYTSKSALLGSSIDYAGTFPPAALSLGEALKKAATFRSGAKHPWLMSKMALPISDLKKITARTLFEAGADGSSWLFTALGSFGKDTPAGEFQKSLEWDLREIRRCNERGIDASLRQWIISYETRLPPDAKIEPALDRVATLTFGQLTPYFELGWEGDWENNFPKLADAVVAWIEESTGAPVMPGIKVRTGGAYVPTSRQLAHVIETCLSRGLRFKATQGLHHALTHRDEKGQESHGFVNLFAALALAQGHGTESFGAEKIAELLSDGDRKSFTLGETSLKWRDHEIDCDAIEAGRRRHAATFGSCSLDEPDEFLAELFP